MSTQSQILNPHEVCIESPCYEEIFITALRHILLRGTRVEDGDKTFREIQNFSFKLTNPFDRVVWNGDRKVNYDFAMKLFLWVLSADPDPTTLMGVNPNATNYIDKDEDGNAAPLNTAYGPRIKEQLPDLIQELRERPHSRRATINILDSEDRSIRFDGSTKIEYPCCDSINFNIRDGELNCSVIMRSNNFVTTVVYDVFMFTLLQEYVLHLLNHDSESGENLRMGTYYHHAQSAHYFLAQAPFVESILTNTSAPFLWRAI